ncbi:STAS domain-containing protein [Streptomyces gardneri]|uniref:STAS domain-containing protein n=1 Tax=Nocardia TaxID=1817 RepID=UPI001358D4D3|nr:MULTISPECIES: STAS domain-containing protein [Nocardia]MBF6167093.1 STAS domain-containing protein [Streptomyces gardneri]MBF6204140.1 STAS domain-containing protein [Streptomyces gardneri]UAK30652.1 STAS domain-containing protein [Nocardia asteroides]
MSAISLLREHAEGVHLNGSGPGRRRDNRLWAQRVDRRRECVVVRVEGELDAAVSAEFFETVDRALQSPCDAVVIDLRAARFMSLRAAARLGALRGDGLGRPDLRVVAGGPGVERALEVTGVRSMFPRYTSMRAALDA